MTFSLADISRSVRKAPRIVVYGVPGVGKSTFASKAPNPIFIPVEDGLASIECDAFPQCESLDDVLAAIGTLIEEDHDYQTVVLDSADVLEALIWEKVCKDGGKDTIGEFAYGKGYDASCLVWRDILRGLDKIRDKGIAVVVIAHSHVIRFESPDSDGYDRYTMRLHKKSNAAIHDWADAVLFANHEVRVVSASGDRKRGVSTGRRVLHTVEQAAWLAKNRYGMDPTLPLEWDEVAKFLAPKG